MSDVNKIKGNVLDADISDLTDVPEYSGFGGRFLQINPSGDSIILTVAHYIPDATGHSNEFVKATDDGTALEFYEMPLIPIPETFMAKRVLKVSDDSLSVEWRKDNTDQINTLKNRMDVAESKLIDLSIETSYLSGRQLVGGDMFIDTFINEKLTADFETALNKPVEIMDDTDWNNNWKEREGNPSFKNGFMRPRKQPYMLEVLDQYNLEGIGQAYKNDIDWDSDNNCYWMMTAKNSNDIGEIIKLSPNMKDGKVDVIGRWYLPAAGSNVLWVSVCSDGNYLYFISHAVNPNGKFHKISINSDGTLGKTNIKSGEEIVLDSTCLEFTPTVLVEDYYNSVIDFDSYNVITLCIDSGQVKLKLIGKGGGGQTGGYTGFENFVGGSTSSARTICKDDTYLYIRMDDPIDDKRCIYKFHLTNDIDSYNVKKCSGRFNLTRDVDGNHCGITIGKHGDILDVVCTTSNGKFLARRALKNALWAENQVGFNYKVYNVNSPFALMIDSDGDYWTADTNASANQVKIHRFKDDGTYNATGYISGENWEYVIGLTTDGTNVWILGGSLTYGKNIYKVSLSTLITDVEASNTITLGSGGYIEQLMHSIPNKALADLAYCSDLEVILIINNEDNKIDTLEIDNSAYNEGEYYLNSATGAWTGITYKNGNIYIGDSSSDTKAGKIYVLPLDKQSDSNCYISHIYQDPTLQYTDDTYRMCGFDFKNNILVVTMRRAMQLSGIKIIDNDSVMQLHTFMNSNNILLSDDVSCATPIAERYFDPKEYVENIDIYSKKSFIFSDTATNDTSTTILNNGNIVIAYINNSYYGTFIIYNEDGDTVVAGPTVFESASTSNLSTTTLNNGNFVIAYKDVGNSNYGTFVIYSSSGSLVKGPTVFESARTEDISIVTLNNNNFAIAYRDYDNSEYGTFIIYNEDGDTVVAGPTVFESASINWISATALNNGNFVINYMDGGNSNYGTFVFYSGTGSLVSGPTVFESAGSTLSIKSTLLNNGNFVVIYERTTDLRFRIFTQTGSLVAGPSVFDNTDTQYMDVATLNNNNFVIAWMDDNASDVGLFSVYSESGSLLLNTETFSTQLVARISASPLNNGDFLISFRGNSGYGNFVIYSPPGVRQSHRNIPDKNYMAVGYGDEGFSILHLDEYLNDGNYSGGQWIPRYDVSKIRATHYKRGTDNIFIGASNYTNYIFIEKDMIFVGDEAGAGLIFVDLKSGKATWFGTSSGGNNYDGLLSERNNGNGGDGIFNLELTLSAVGNKIHARTFTKEDESDYQGENPVTLVAIATDGGCDLLKIDWDSEGNRTFVKVWNNIHSSTIIGRFANWIAPSGYLFSGNYDPNGKVCKTNKVVWEINQNNTYDGTEIGANILGGYVLDIAPNSRCWRTVNGDWRHQLICGCMQDSSYNGAERIAIVDIENEVKEDIRTDQWFIASYHGHRGADIFEDFIVSCLCNTGEVLSWRGLIFYKKLRFNDKLDSSHVLNNWTSKEINDITRPYFSIGGNESSNGPSIYPRYSKNHNMVMFGDNDKGLQFFHFQNMDECIHESIESDTDNPEKYHYIQNTIISDENRVERISKVESGNIVYTDGDTKTWSNKTSDISSSEIDRDDVSNGYVEWTVASGYIGLGITFESTDQSGGTRITVTRDPGGGSEAILSDWDGKEINLWYDEDSTPNTGDLETCVVWITELDPTYSYNVKIANSALDNDYSGDKISIKNFYAIKTMADAEIETTLKLWHVNSPGSTFDYILNSNSVTDIVEERSFSANGDTFVLDGNDVAYKFLQVSEDNGATWLDPDDPSITWGSNATDYDDETINSNGYFGVKFETAPTSTVIIRYVPKSNKYKLITTMKHAKYGNERKLNKNIRLLDHALELY